MSAPLSPFAFRMHMLRPLERNLVTGEFRCFCSCGWSFISKDAAEVQTRAATHDMDEPNESEAA